MKKGMWILKGMVLFVWLVVLTGGVTVLARGLSGQSDFFVSNQKKMEEKAKEKRKEQLQAFLNKAEQEKKEQKGQAVEETKYAYLTFDDGPSDNTDKILDILKEKEVQATFFVVGKTDDNSKKRYQRILREGHSLGMHSYTHDYSYIYGSMEHYKEDLLKLQDYLYDVTGERIRLYRFPGGSSNSVAKIPIQSCIQFLDEKGIVYYDWNASSEDAVSIGASCEQLNENVLKDALLYHNTIILMHDLHECSATVKGLGELIDRLKKEGYEMKKISLETIPVQHVKKKEGKTFDS